MRDNALWPVKMREWNPLWVDPEDADDAAYLAAIRRIIMASINWIEAHPKFEPKWREINKRQLMRQHGVPDSVDENTVHISAAWEDYYQPQSSHTRHWFREMASACSEGVREKQPSAHMMAKGIAAGALVKKHGWDYFNSFMLSEPDDTVSH